jgi:protein phosphatase
MRRRKAPEKTELLKRVPLFGGLSKRALTEVAKIADEIDLADGKVLIREDDPGRQFFVLLDGKAEVRRKGRKVNTLEAGDFFGEISLVTERPTTATVTLTAGTTYLVQIAKVTATAPTPTDAVQGPLQGRPQGIVGRGPGAVNARRWRQRRDSAKISRSVAGRGHCPAAGQPDNQCPRRQPRRQEWVCKFQSRPSATSGAG